MLEKLKPHATLATALVCLAGLVGIGLFASTEATADAAWVSARQMYGLTAFGFLMAASLIGPAAAVLTRMPGKSFWISARRAVGVSSFALVAAHVASYLVPTVARSWRELFTPGWLWTGGLFLGLLAFTDLLVLSWVSRDAEVKRLGGRRWKALHRTVHIAIPVVFVHALLIGGDFGLNRPPDAPEADVGSLIAFAVLLVLWLALLELRRRRVRWPADSARPSQPARES